MIESGSLSQKVVRLLLVVAACCASSLRAESEDKSKVKVEGFIRSLATVQSNNRGDNWHEGRVTLKSKRKKDFRAELEFEVETKSDTLDVLEAVIDRKMDDRWRWELGFTQKRMGVEYEENRLERVTIDRSYLYQKLELFNYVGRETVFRLRQENQAETFSDWSYALAYSESQTATAIANWQTNLPNFFDARYGVWLQGGVEKMQDDVQLVYSLMNSLWHRSGDSFWQAEWALGVDPQQSEYEHFFGNKKTVYFSGLNGIWGTRFAGDEEESWTFLGGPSAFLHDNRKTAYNSLGFMLGVRYTLGDLRVSLNTEVVGTNSRVDTGKRTYDESSAKVEALYVL